jgi:hypothetical protein
MKNSSFIWHDFLLHWFIALPENIDLSNVEVKTAWKFASERLMRLHGAMFTLRDHFTVQLQFDFRAETVLLHQVR